MDIAREASPHVDRLVLTVQQGALNEYKADLLGLAHARGLDSLDLLPHFGSFLLAGRLTVEVARLRMQYRSTEHVRNRLSDLADKGLIEDSPSGWTATDAMRPLLTALFDAQASVAAAAWSSHADTVASVSKLARGLVMSASPDHPVAVVHRDLPLPEEPHLRLHHLLVTVRFIRQHDHAKAWLARDLTAPATIALTTLWQAGEIEPDDPGMHPLVDRGLASEDPPALTNTGQVLRDEIEAATNERSSITYAALGSEAPRFLRELATLPSA